MKEKDRNISMLDFLEALQREYLYFDIRSKIYPSAKDRDFFKKVRDLKREKIEDISGKNSLRNMFNDEETSKRINVEFFTESGLPKRMGKRDWYFYYRIGSDFSFEGMGVKLLSYDKINNSAEIQLPSGSKTEVGMESISRIL